VIVVRRTGPTLLAYVGTGLIPSIRVEVFEGVRGVEISLVSKSKCLLLNRDSLSLNLTVGSPLQLCRLVRSLRP